MNYNYNWQHEHQKICNQIHENRALIAQKAALLEAKVLNHTVKISPDGSIEQQAENAIHNLTVNYYASQNTTTTNPTNFIIQ